MLFRAENKKLRYLFMGMWSCILAIFLLGSLVEVLKYHLDSEDIVEMVNAEEPENEKESSEKESKESKEETKKLDDYFSSSLFLQLTSKNHRALHQEFEFWFNSYSTDIPYPPPEVVIC